MKVLFDTNFLIECFRDCQKREQLDTRLDKPLQYMSSVVAMELFAGCRCRRHEKELAAFLKPYEKAGRIVAPDHGALLESGRVLASLSGAGIAKAHLRQISNDVIIAVTAGRAGVVVITRNAKDFSRIANFTRFRWMTPA